MNSMHVIHEALNFVLEKLNLPTIEAKLLGKKAGRPLTEILKEKIPEIETSTIRKVEKEIYRKYLEVSFSKCRPFPEVKQVLEQLILRGFKLAIVTTTPRIPVERDLTRFGLKRYFNAIITREDVKNYKPSPEVLLKATNLLNVKMDECVLVGDSPIDIKTGKASGVKTIAVLTGLCGEEALRKEKPDWIIRKLDELLEILEKI